MLKLKYFIGAGLCCGAFVLFSAFGGEKMTLVEQMKKVDAVVAENVATFESEKRAECNAMALQKAIGLAEVKLASEPKAAPGKAAVTAKKVTPAPKKAPKVTPKGVPDQKTRTGASNTTTPADQKTRTGASTITSDPASQKVRGGATKVDTKNN
jgi:hypothetical protein